MPELIEIERGLTQLLEKFGAVCLPHTVVVKSFGLFTRLNETLVIKIHKILVITGM